jgi:peptidoglycan/LPS O-acetylase OafA/YrhL
MIFYLLVPFLWLAPTGLKRVSILASAILPALLATFAASRWVDGTTRIAHGTFFYYWFPAQFPVFAVGLIYYFVAFYREGTHASRRTFLTLCAFIGLFQIAIVCGLSDTVGIASTIIIGMAFVCLTLSLQKKANSIVVNRVTVFLGKISFSLYIFHFFVLNCINEVARLVHPGYPANYPAVALLPIFVLAVLTTTMLAILSKRFIEDPWIAFGHQLSGRLAAAPPVSQLRRSQTTSG